METITSVKNPLVVETKKIKNEPNGKLFIENPKLILEAHNLSLPFEYLLFTKKAFDKYCDKYKSLLNYKYFLVGENVIEFLSDTKTPQGVVAVIDFAVQGLTLPKNNFLVLENLQDPGNLGTIIRSARGTDFGDIFLLNCVNCCNQKVVRSTMGNLFNINIHTGFSTDEFLDFAKKNKLNLYTADMSGENLFEMKKPKGIFGIVIGNEGQGLSNKMKTVIKNSISIPMKNNLESLNAGVSCSIIMYYLDNIK